MAGYVEVRENPGPREDAAERPPASRRQSFSSTLSPPSSNRTGGIRWLLAGEIGARSEELLDPELQCGRISISNLRLSTSLSSAPFLTRNSISARSREQFLGSLASARSWTSRALRRRWRKPFSLPSIVKNASYCISGNSSGQQYAWWLDLGDDTSGMSAEPSGLNAGPVMPLGANAAALASAFASTIINGCNAKALKCGALPSGNCFDLVFATGLCASGTCVDGMNIGSACVVNADCSFPALNSLKVGPSGLNPTCKVTASGCQYDPVITLGPGPAVPAAGRWGLLALVLALALAGGLLVARRLASHG